MVKRGIDPRDLARTRKLAARAIEEREHDDNRSRMIKQTRNDVQQETYDMREKEQKRAQNLRPESIQSSNSPF